MKDYIGGYVKNVQHNVKQQKQLEKKEGRKLRNINHGLFNRFTFKCHLCGQYVNAKIVAFFKYDVTRLECYTCQDENRRFFSGRKRKKKKLRWGRVTADTYSEIAI